MGFSLCEAAECRRREERGVEAPQGGAETSAEGARVEAPRGLGYGEGVSPSSSD